MTVEQAVGAILICWLWGLGCGAIFALFRNSWSRWIY